VNAGTTGKLFFGTGTKLIIQSSKFIRISDAYFKLFYFAILRLRIEWF